MSAYRSDSPQGRCAAVLASAGLNVNDRLRGTAPGATGTQIHVELGPWAYASPVALNVVVFGAPGVDLWAIAGRVVDALEASDEFGATDWATIYTPDSHQMRIAVTTGELLPDPRT